MSTAISATLPLEGGSETELPLSDRDNFPSSRLKSDPWAFEALPDAFRTEEQQQVSVHLFIGGCDGDDLDLPELGCSVHLHVSVFFPST